MLKRKAKPVVVEAETDEESGGGLMEIVSTVLWALGIAFVLRTFLFQPFTIPSASMYPGLVEGDYIITSKYSVGYGKHAAEPLPFPDVDGRLLGRGPKRGDVVVFRPEGVNYNFIKRVVGLPGDRMQMIDGLLHINGSPVSAETLRTEAYVHIVEGVERGTETAEVIRETLTPGDDPHIIYNTSDNDSGDNTSVFTVPAGHYFMMGDNRDHSGDSRYPVRGGRLGISGTGYVPAENIIGRAEFILLSVDHDFRLFNPLSWGNMRGSRFFKRID